MNFRFYTGDAMKGDGTRSWLSRLRHDERGTMVTEFVITLPLLLIFLFGFIGVGQLLWYHHIITNGVRDATRYLSRVDSPTVDPHLTRAKNLAMKGIVDTGGSVFYFWTDANSINVTMLSIANPDNAFREDGPVPVVRMSATVAVNLPILGFAFLGMSPSITYTVVDEARWIGR
jgi:Flp pilus assembly protein TadG